MYDLILIDVFNLYYRRKDNILDKDPVSLARNLISYIKDTVSKKVVSDGKVYLLYDPIPKDDLGMSKMFKNNVTERKQILATYKADRVYDTKTLTVVNFVRKYFLHRGPSIVSVISNCFEADDYVESIKAANVGKDIALVTNDNDWSRYLDDHTVMINSDFGKPFTKEDFYEQYKFYPTIASVTIFKALFGDPSDNIQGALILKKVKNTNNIKKDGFAFIQEISKTEANLDDIVKRIKNYTVINLSNQAKLNCEENFVYKIKCLDPKYDVETNFYQNLNVIKCRCDDYSKYATSKDEDAKYNSLIEKTLGYSVKSTTKFKFGNIKMK